AGGFGEASLPEFRSVIPSGVEESLIISSANNQRFLGRVRHDQGAAVACAVSAQSAIPLKTADTTALDGGTRSVASGTAQRPSLHRSYSRNSFITTSVSTSWWSS